MIILEPRQAPSGLMLLLSPLLAIVLTTLAAAGLMAILGQPPLETLEVYFLSPFADAYSRSELIVKATPLALIGAGLAVCFRANVWNIGAAGQYALGAVFATWVALAAPDDAGPELWFACLLAGVVGGMLWAAIPALLRAHLGVNEILVSLMLVYIAEHLLTWLVSGPWKSPYAFGFPYTRDFPEGAWAPVLIEGARLHAGVILAIAAALLLAVMMERSVRGFALWTQGVAPRAAAFAGFSTAGGIWTAFLISGALAGLAGAVEATATLQKLQQDIAMDYGFAAIIVAFLGRLNPLGALIAAVILAVTYIGGENAQIDLNLPKNVTGLFQGMMLFFLLVCDTLIHHRLRIARRPANASVNTPDRSKEAA